MARRVKDKTLDSREARRRIKPRSKPYFRVVDRGLHLGYRRLQGGAGSWTARYGVGGGNYQTEVIGIADDVSDADGVRVLDYWQAQGEARRRMASRALAAAGKHGPVTVAEVVEDYLQFLAASRKTAADARYRAEAFILPPLGQIEVANLTTEMIRRWHADLAKVPPRVRTRVGEAQRHRVPDASEEAVRRRRTTANRVLANLKAALNRAWRDGRVPSDVAWRRVEPFEGVDTARVRYLTTGEVRRLINASDPDFRDLVQAAILTGMRYGELARLTVGDFDPDAGTVAVWLAKSGKSRHAVLTAEGAEFFAALCAGRPRTETLLRKARGGPWKAGHQLRPIADACQRAKIIPPISFHILRHSFASLAVMNGAPLIVVAKALGHADTAMVEKHYGHLSQGFITEALRAAVPTFGIKPRRRVIPLR
jgi:integrase